MKAIFCCLTALLILAACAGLPPADPEVRAPVLSPDEVILYIRTGCPYCEQALETIEDQGIVPETRNVTEDRRAYQELLAIYRQHFPGEGLIVPVIGMNGRYLRGFNRESFGGLLNGRSVANPDEYEFCEEPVAPEAAAGKRSAAPE